jgi:protein-S-isoprenylcysteine O-methyltransferase Ste14
MYHLQMHEHVQVVEEEKFLCERYPTDYQEYMSRVKKFVPFLY